MQKKSTQHSDFSRGMYDHLILKKTLSVSWSTIAILASAFVFAFGYKCFLVPSNLINDMSAGHPGAVKLVSGGFSGISQLILMVASLFPGVNMTTQFEDTLYSIIYFGLNVPVIILAWRGIGKRFTLYTLFNVAMCSVFTNILGFWDAEGGWIAEIARYANQNGGMLTRAILAGICTGISSGLAFKVDASAGGIDVISYLIALKKSVLVGKYNVMINAVIVTLFSLFGSMKIWLGQLPVEGYINSMQYITGALFSAFYLFTTALVIDGINLRNKKVKIEAITANKDLGKIVISALPHGATIIKGEGAYTGKERYVVQIVVSSYEVKEAVRVISEADPQGFIQVIELNRVYGRFFQPPVR